MPIHAMLDIETLGTTSRAPVLSAGVIFFDPVNNNRYEQELFLFDPEQQPGRHIHFSTMKWWMNQNSAAQAHWKNAKFPNLHQELLRFRSFALKHGDITWWACGPHFDMTIMETLFQDQGLEAPWKFWKIRDTRNARDWIDERRVPQNKNAHDPIADCNQQINQVVAFYDIMLRHSR